MDELQEKKIRDLKLKILMAEKELAHSQQKLNLGALLRAGNANQIHKSAERDRVRLEAKLESLRSQLNELQPSELVAAQVAEPTPKPEPVAVKSKPKVSEKPKAVPAKSKPVPATKKAAPKKSATASKSTAKPAKKK